MIFAKQGQAESAKRDEAGYTLIELLIAAAIASVIVGAAAMSIGRILADTKRTNDHLTAMMGAENAAFWIGRDTVMAERVTTANLTAPNFIILQWTDWGYGTPSVYHTVTYSIENVSGNIGTLNRWHQSSAGLDSTMRISDNIYYNVSDVSGTTSASYGSNVLALKVVGKYGTAETVKEIGAYSRPNFN